MGRSDGSRAIVGVQAKAWEASVGSTRHRSHRNCRSGALGVCFGLRFAGRRLEAVLAGARLRFLVTATCHLRLADRRHCPPRPAAGQR